MDASAAKPETYGEQVKVGVARGALLDRLLRDPRVTAVLDDLGSADAEARSGGILDRPSEILARAFDVAQRERDARRLRVERTAALTRGMGLAWVGPWLPEFLESAAHFRHALKDEDLQRCALADTRLRAARAHVRSWRMETARSPWTRTDSVVRLLAALIPATEPADWESRTPDWVELFTILVEHAAERLDWTSEATGADCLWPYLLHSAFVWDVEPGDDPEVLHGLVGLWAASCRATVDAHTRPRLPRGLVPDSSGSYRDGRLREGRRDKIRRWVGWYVDREIKQVKFNDVLRAAFPNSAAPLERSSEVRRHIGEVKQLLAIEIPLDAGQAVRLWNLAQANRPLLTLLPADGG